MLGGMRSILQWGMSKRTVIGVLLLVATGAMMISGFAGDIGRAIIYRLPSVGLGAAPIYDGPASLEERILDSDVVARVKLLSTSPTVEAFGDGWSGDRAYVSALEFRFEVLEYLTGSGGGEVVGIVYGNDYYQTRLGALTLGVDLTDTHDPAWDEREAIVFLSREKGVLSTMAEPDRYVLGSADYGMFDSDSYTIDSIHAKRWLPAAVNELTVARGAGSGSDVQRFLTGAERAEGESGEKMTDYNVARSAHNAALGTGGDSSTISLSRLRELIDVLQDEIDEGDGSVEYRECVLEKYRRHREVEYKYEASGGVTYGTISYDHELGSGSPADTVFALGTMPFHPPDDYDPRNHEYANSQFEWAGWIEGRDAHLFHVANDKSVIATSRPLAKGEYRFYFNSLEAEYIPCDAYPDRLRTSDELVVQVLAPTDTLHEALLDTADIDGAVGADGANGMIQPQWFEAEAGRETLIKRIEWSDGHLGIDLSPPTELAGHRLDFIALDGSVSLRLKFDDAVEIDENGTAVLGWEVCTQPWQPGDQLMLRLAEGIPDDGVHATNDSDCP